MWEGEYGLAELTLDNESRFKIIHLMILLQLINDKYVVEILDLIQMSHHPNIPKQPIVVASTAHQQADGSATLIRFQLVLKQAIESVPQEKRLKLLFELQQVHFYVMVSNI
jgi:hypothetical protein